MTDLTTRDGLADYLKRRSVTRRAGIVLGALNPTAVRFIAEADTYAEVAALVRNLRPDQPVAEPEEPVACGCGCGKRWCGSVGPNIGNEGRPECHEVGDHRRHRGFEGSGYEDVTWTDSGSAPAPVADLGELADAADEAFRRARRASRRVIGTIRVDPVPAPDVRERIFAVLMSPEHAPMDDHDPRDGSCRSCPWPVYQLGPEGITDALLAAGLTIPAPVDREKVARAIFTSAAPLLHGDTWETVGRSYREGWLDVAEVAIEAMGLTVKDPRP